MEGEARERHKARWSETGAVSAGRNERVGHAAERTMGAGREAEASARVGKFCREHAVAREPGVQGPRAAVPQCRSRTRGNRA